MSSWQNYVKFTGFHNTMHVEISTWRCRWSRSECSPRGRARGARLRSRRSERAAPPGGRWAAGRRPSQTPGACRGVLRPPPRPPCRPERRRARRTCAGGPAWSARGRRARRRRGARSRAARPWGCRGGARGRTRACAPSRGSCVTVSRAGTPCGWARINRASWRLSAPAASRSPESRPPAHVANVHACKRQDYINNKSIILKLDLTSVVWYPFQFKEEVYIMRMHLIESSIYSVSRYTLYCAFSSNIRNE